MHHLFDAVSLTSCRSAEELSLAGCKHAFHKLCIRDYALSAPAAEPPAGKGKAKKKKPPAKGKKAAAAGKAGPVDSGELGCPVCYQPLSV